MGEGGRRGMSSQGICPLRVYVILFYVLIYFNYELICFMSVTNWTFFYSYAFF